MSFLCFEDDELNIIFKVVNKLQMFFIQHMHQWDSLALNNYSN